jgi:hypothetical protein
MLLVELKQSIDSLDAETVLVSGKIVAGEPAKFTPLTMPRTACYTSGMEAVLEYPAYFAGNLESVLAQEFVVEN